MLDKEILEQIRLLGAEDSSFQESLLSAFHEQMRAGLARLQDCAEAGHMGELQAIAHRLRGSCLNMGAVALASLLEQLETPLVAPNPRECARQLAEIAATWDMTRDALHAYFS
ncbi:MAG: Hpt domain-containing protein [Bacteroidetes bacterium]|nr:Hpt domain-containing protein [Bacteroidota bacterium]